MIPITTAFLASPAKFPPTHESRIGMIGEMPTPTTTLPAYWIADVFVAISMAYPAIATGHTARRNGPRIPFLSDRYDMTSVKMQPATKGGTDRSCA